MAKKPRVHEKSVRSGARSATKSWIKKMARGVEVAGRDAGLYGEMGAEEASGCTVVYGGDG